MTEMDSATIKLPSTFIRSRGKKPTGMSDFDEFNTLGNFSSKLLDKDECPSNSKMKCTAILLGHNKSFEHYFTEMKKRNL